MGKETRQAFDATSFLDGANTHFIESLYARYLKAPETLAPEWRALFARFDPTEAPARPRASWDRNSGDRDSADEACAAPAAADLSQDGLRAAALDSVRAIMMIRAYRFRGHFAARLDPLGLEPPQSHPELNPASYGFTDADLDRPIFLDYVLGLETASVREMLGILERTYCGHLGVEFMHIADPEQKSWIQERIEGPGKSTSLPHDEKRALFERLVQVEGFETFLAGKYIGTKRFGLDGSEMMIPALERIIARASALGVKDVVLGMPHRGRLNVLAHIMDKPYRAIFHEFQGGAFDPAQVEGSGDVKYHLGASADRDFGAGPVHLSLTANPSHLESVDPVVLGKVRAKQDQLGDTDRTRVLPLLLHGDAAFAGQGVVAECFGLSALKGHRSGGAIHVVVNNQIGFTTSPRYARSSPYPSDVAKMVQAPIFHVNGDDPEAVLYACTIAAEFRQKFHMPVIIDLFCYRRFGHNEADEPMFTQPLMYKKIKTHPSVVDIFETRLCENAVLKDEEAQACRASQRARFERDFQEAAGYAPHRADWLDGRWAHMERATGYVRRGTTGVKGSLLRVLAQRLSTIPEGFSAHRTVRRLMEARGQAVKAQNPIDWATAEALAFATLLHEGFPVRLVGQDSERGTFSQRHAVLVDQETEETHTPLDAISDKAARFEVVNSMLSEEAVLGFEFGYSLAEPNALVLWEAQFGDFANNAQVIIDQFISSGERKWLRMSGLVLLLPHGYEGQGPEHSSARLERFLQMCAEDNMQVANCSTPANYFHILRRQLHRPFRKPLVLMTPKSLLRHKRCVSSPADFKSDTSFHRIMLDHADATQNGVASGTTLRSDRDIKRVILCSGKVYYDLFEERAKRAMRKKYLLRVEQLYPFPRRAVAAELKRFRNAQIIWCQEEPKNMGAWSFVAPHIEEAMARAGCMQKRPLYVGRPEAAATGTGLAAQHKYETEKLLDAALRRQTRDREIC